MPKLRETHHESYQDHNCAILGSKDVIMLDIRGGHVVSRFRRWWWDLFLVSSSDDRSNVLFSSSNALRMERLRQFRKFGRKIHPFSKFRNFWDWFMLHVFILHCIMIHINTSIVYGDLSIYTYYFDSLLEFFILSDVMINSVTAFIDSGMRRVVFDTKRVLKHYCSTKVLFHVASAIPLQWIMYLRYGENVDCSLCKCNTFITVTKFRTVLILARAYEYSFLWSRYRKSMNMTYFFKFLRIGVLSSLTVHVFRDLCDTVHLHIMIIKNNLDIQTRPVTILIAKHGLETPLAHSNFFAHEILRICASLYLFTFLVPTGSYYDNLTITLISYFVANAFFMWITLEFYAFIVRITFADDSLILKKKMAYEIIKSRQLSVRLKRQIDEYFDYNMAKVKIHDRNNRLYQCLPKVLRQSAYSFRYTEYIERIEYFTVWPVHVLHNIVMILKEEVFLRNSLVAEPWVESEGLYIVVHGELAVYTNEVETGHLIDGDYFGELSLVTDSEIRISTVISITQCWILILNKTEFRRLMRKHPVLFFDMKRKLKEKYNQRFSRLDLVPKSQCKVDT